MSAWSNASTSSITPLLADLGLDLYDLEHAGGVLRVVVDRPGGVDIDAIADATRLDLPRSSTTPIRSPGRYTLEVTSPGLERTLRTPAHFQRRRRAASSRSARTATWRASAAPRAP